MTNPTRQSKSKKNSPPLPVLQPLVAGIDVGATAHWVCAPSDDETPNIRKFGTTTAQLGELANWLVAQGVTSVAMESTSVYWIPVYELLESRGLEVVLVNARALHNVPGRKTDVADCHWIQKLHSCGLLRGSFRPSESIARMRSVHRSMGNLVEMRTRCVQWMQKALDQMNVQVHHAVTDITGVTGLAIVRAIVGGERDPMQLAKLRDRRCRKSLKEIAEHLTGTWRDDHLFTLRSSLALYDAFDNEIAAHQAELMKEIAALHPAERRDEAVPPHPKRHKQNALRGRGEEELRATLWRFAGVDLTRIDGISTGAAQMILTEVGPNLAAFKDEHHFISWLRLCPRTAVSGGKPIKKRRNGQGASRVAWSLKMGASTLHRSKSALGAYYRRIARNKGKAVAVFATARKLATLVYRLLRYGQDYIDIGEQAYEEQYRARSVAALTERARSLGFTLTEVAPD